MNEYLLLSKGESKDTGRARQFILANTFESFVGALYLDSGYQAADVFIVKHLLKHLPEILQKKLFQLIPNFLWKITKRSLIAGMKAIEKN